VLEIEIIKSNDYARFLSDLKEKVRTSQQKAITQVNKELILLYHHIGRQILQMQEAKGWGSKIIDQLSKDLSSSFAGIRGFSVRNLKYMRQFALEYEDVEFVQQVVAQIPWAHILRIMTAIKETEIRNFYIQKSIQYNWSRDTLETQIKDQLHTKEGKAITNFKEKLPCHLSLLAKNYLKDPYCFDFLGIHDNAIERDIENALIKHMEKFLLELGGDFAFVGRQYKLIVSNTPYYLDLLFYHLKLHCYVVIELKATDFKPAHIGQLNFYLSAVDDLIKTDVDNPSIGLIICKQKDNIKAEYALKDINKPIGLAEYQLSKAIPDNLKRALPSVAEIEAELNREQINKETSE
jgi:predicted nuclease of restriction endonuclease-like (RecB) superfamily